MSTQVKTELSRIRRFVDVALRHNPRYNPETYVRPPVDVIISEQFFLNAVECGEGKGRDGQARIPMPPELINEYDALREQWVATGNFPWAVRAVTIDGRKFFLGYVSDKGLSSNRELPSDMMILLYPADDIDIDVPS
jgi:hypothetical protein